VSDVSDNFVDAIDASIKSRPYTTLALVAGFQGRFGADDARSIDCCPSLGKWAASI